MSQSAQTSLYGPGHAQVETQMQLEGQRVPNLTHPAAPVGGEENATVLTMVGLAHTCVPEL